MLLPIADALVKGGLALYEYTGYERYTELIRQTEELYDITGEKEWLDAAIDTAWYLSTWQYSST